MNDVILKVIFINTCKDHRGHQIYREFPTQSELSKKDLGSYHPSNIRDTHEQVDQTFAKVLKRHSPNLQIYTSSTIKH